MSMHYSMCYWFLVKHVTSNKTCQKVAKLTSPVAKYFPSPEKASEVMVFLLKSKVSYMLAKI